MIRFDNIFRAGFTSDPRDDIGKKDKKKGNSS